MKNAPPPELPRYVIVDHRAGVIVHWDRDPTVVHEVGSRYKRQNAEARIGLYEYCGEVNEADVAALVQQESADAAQRQVAQENLIKAHAARVAAEDRARQTEADRLIQAANDAEMALQRRMAQEAADEELITKKIPPPADRRRP